MKKLLSLACCATAALAATSASAAVEQTIGTVGVISVTVPAGQANTIIAAAFKDLSDTTKDASIANLVKTTNLKEGDKLMLFTGSSEPYSVWVLSGDNGTWTKSAKSYYVASDGTLTEGTGTAASDTTATAGTGLWLVRGNATDAATVTIYGAYVDGAKTTTTTADAWNLVGNPGIASFSGFTGVAGDKIVTVVNGALRQYAYSGSAWYYETTEKKTVTVAGKERTVVSKKKVEGTPSIAPGEGFWYYTQSAQTLTWSDTNATE